MDKVKFCEALRSAAKKIDRKKQSKEFVTYVDSFTKEICERLESNEVSMEEVFAGIVGMSYIALYNDVERYGRG